MASGSVLDIPIIDFSPFLASHPTGRSTVAQAIYRACHQVGFLYLTHPGISPAKIEQALTQSRQFFDLPLSEKQTIAWSSTTSNRGYIGVGRERLDTTQPSDLKEAFNIGKAGAAEILTPKNSNLNLWPADQDEFQTVMCDFFNVCASAVDQIFRAFAIALNMPEDHIAQQHQSHDYTLRLLHYPPLSGQPQPGQQRAGAHSDYGSLTLLFQDDVGGLEVQLPNGEWIAAPAITDAVLINTGDLMQRWSNDIFRSTRHRVVLPAEPGRDRYSIAFFCQPDADATITCFPSCQSPENPTRYAPVTSGDYLLSRLQATYQISPTQT